MWRRLRPGELDHEALWLAVSLGALAIAWAWLCFGLPLPPCPLHALAGIPCPTCGATRCFAQLIQGHWLAAFRLNPLVCAGFGAVAIFDLYALAILAARAPRFRWAPTPRAALALRVAVVFFVLGNWAWLIADGR